MRLVPSHIAEKVLHQKKRGLETQLRNLKKKLISFAVPEHQIQLILARYGENRSFDQIAKDLGWTSGSSVARHLRQALKDLKTKRFA